MQANSNSNHSLIYGLLVVLAISIMGVPHLHLSVVPHNAVLFSIAGFMAALVSIQYMGLKLEGALVYWLVGVPFVLFAILVIILVPEFVTNHIILTAPAAGGH